MAGRDFSLASSLCFRAPLSKNPTAPGGAINAARAAEKFWAHVPRIGTFAGESGHQQRTPAALEQHLLSIAIEQPLIGPAAVALLSSRSSDLLPQANGVGEMRVGSCREAISG